MRDDGFDNAEVMSLRLIPGKILGRALRSRGREVRTTASLAARIARLGWCKSDRKRRENLAE